MENWEEREASALWFSEMETFIRPHYEEQLTTMLSLVPFGEQDTFSVVDIGCGEALFGECLLTHFPNSSYLGLDGSPLMRNMAEVRLEPFGARAEIAEFEVNNDDSSSAQMLPNKENWLAKLTAIDLVVATAFDIWPDGRQELFHALRQRMSTQGGMLFANISRGSHPSSAEIFAFEWVRAIAGIPSAHYSEQVAKFVENLWHTCRAVRQAKHGSYLLEGCTGWMSQDYKV